MDQPISIVDRDSGVQVRGLMDHNPKRKRGTEGKTRSISFEVAL